MGFLDDAEVEIQELPDDPYGFGRSFWPVQIIAVDDPKVTKNADKYGMMVTWKCIHPDFADLEKLGYGNWLQLPVPKVLKDEGVPWEPKSMEARKVLFDLKELYKALGFSADEMGGVGANDMIGKTCLAKIFTRKNDEGFTQFNVTAFKPMPDDDSMNEFTANGQSNGKSTADLIDEELNS